MYKYLLPLIAFSLIVGGCKKKEQEPEEPQCTLHGFTVAADHIHDNIAECTYGTIDLTSDTLTKKAVFLSGLSFDNAAFNTSDHCYYVCKQYSDNTSSNIIYKIDLKGAVTTLTSDEQLISSAIAYNKLLNKFYCVGRTSILELNITGNKFEAKEIVVPAHAMQYYRSGLAVDNVTGAIYYLTSDSTSTNYYVERFKNGAGGSEIVASGVGARLYGLQFNKSDGKLYALSYPWSNINWSYTPDLVKIDPLDGTISKLASPGFFIVPGSCSTCIDPCSDQYIISTYSYDYHLLATFSTAGALIKKDTASPFYQGLEMN